MLTTTNLIKELVNNGYNAEEVETVKNGVIFHGVVIDNGKNIRPTFYVENYKYMSASEAVTAIKHALVTSTLEVDTDNLQNPDFIKAHATIALQRASDEPLVKKAVNFMDGVEAYIRVKIDDNASFKLTEKLADAIGLNTQNVFTSAELNTFANTKIQTLTSTLGMPDDLKQTYVVTNKSNLHGASAILDTASIKALSEKLGVSKWFVIPSSIHECLITPYIAELAESMTASVNEVNTEQVADFEQLGDKAYVLEVK